MKPLSFGCYGKLPLSPEFIRYNATGLEVQILDQWFQEGLHQAKTRIGPTWSADYIRSGPWNFLFVPEGHSHLLLGVLTPSKDEVGREFPFLLFLRLSLESLKTFTWLVPLGAEAFLRHANEQAREGWSGLDLRGFREGLETWAIPDFDQILSAKQTYREALKTYTLVEFWKQLFGDSPHRSKYPLYDSLRMCLEPIRKASSKKLTWALRFPLLTSAETETFDLPFWLDLCSRLVGQGPDPQFLLWQRRPWNEQPCLTCCFSKPLSGLVFFMMGGKEDASWYDVVRLNDAQVRSAEAIQSHPLDESHMTLEEYLNNAG